MSIFGILVCSRMIVGCRQEAWIEHGSIAMPKTMVLSVTITAQLDEDGRATEQYMRSVMVKLGFGCVGDASGRYSNWKRANLGAVVEVTVDPNRPNSVA